jgi:hypothetical protein
MNDTDFDKRLGETVANLMEESPDPLPFPTDRSKRDPADIAPHLKGTEDMFRHRRRWPIMLVSGAAVLLLAVVFSPWSNAGRDENILIGDEQGDASRTDSAENDPPSGTAGHPPQVLDGIAPESDTESAEALVLDAFTAIHDADWDRFLAYLAPDGQIYSRENQTARHWSDQAATDSTQNIDDLDYDNDGTVSYAEMFVLAAHYLALQPIEVLGCEPAKLIDRADPPVGDVVECMVTDSAVFHRAGGVMPDPISVQVRDGQIIRIGMATVSGIPNAMHTLGGCSECARTVDFAEEVFLRTTAEYMEWLGVPSHLTWEEHVVDAGDEFAVDETAADDPLYVGFIGMNTTGADPGSGFVGWINPDSFEQHRESVSQWLEERD